MWITEINLNPNPKPIDSNQKYRIFEIAGLRNNGLYLLVQPVGQWNFPHFLLI